ncbi:MAG: hypothetical protein BWY43_00827 [candidate division WS2 bacterium ADurb.Bin280]|uniref:Double zinc ribbon n=1 Tax=candidate division WS2 bacterium ADurb.Bin280 TaxID=1852829 RepID=A0A1V5SBA9_9BACT|nr:MAG: hypothetical protein BWY43_00827 [candidate division WS2 bacterium ADurb.Bin280]
MDTIVRSQKSINLGNERLRQMLRGLWGAVSVRLGNGPSHLAHQGRVNCDGTPLATCPGAVALAPPKSPACPRCTALWAQGPRSCECCGMGMRVDVRQCPHCGAPTTVD